MRQKKPTLQELITEFNNAKHSLVHGLSPLFPVKLQSGEWKYDLYLSNKESVDVRPGKLLYFHTSFASCFPLYEYRISNEQYEQMTSDLPKQENKTPMTY